MKYLKTYKVFEASHEEIMDAYYGTDVVSECNSIIEDIIPTDNRMKVILKKGSDRLVRLRRVKIDPNK